MSKYLIRHIEAKYEKIDGQVWNTGDLFSKDNVSEGDVFRVNSPDHKFYVSKNGKWEPVDELPSDSEILGTLETRNSLSTQSADDGQYIRIRLGGEKYVIRQNGEWEPYPSDKVYRGWRLLKTYGTPTPGESCSDWKRVEFEVDGKKKTFMENDCWANNGGAIRDDFISDQWGFIDCPFRSRGIPDDISPETRESMTYDGKISGYSHTWATISEWIAMSDAEEERTINFIKEHIAKGASKRIESKIDFIISHMKDPMSIKKEDVPGYVPEGSFDDGELDDIDEVDDESSEQEFKEELSENMSKLFLIAEEIGKAELIAELNGVFSSDIRIIYYMM